MFFLSKADVIKLVLIVNNQELLLLSNICKGRLLWLLHCNCYAPFPQILDLAGKSEKQLNLLFKSVSYAN